MRLKLSDAEKARAEIERMEAAAKAADEGQAWERLGRLYLGVIWHRARLIYRYGASEISRKEAQTLMKQHLSKKPKSKPEINKPAAQRQRAPEKRATGEALLHFRFNTYEAAAKQANIQARRCGMSTLAFHILSEGGKFAIAPAHVRPKSAPPQFKKGDEVYDLIIHDSRGRIKEAGPEQSLVSYYHKQRGEQIVPNCYLLRASDFVKLADDLKPPVPPEPIRKKEETKVARIKV